MAKPRIRELVRELDMILTWTEVKAMALQLGVALAALNEIAEGNIASIDRFISTMDIWLKTYAKASWNEDNWKMYASQQY